MKFPAIAAGPHNILSRYTYHFIVLLQVKILGPIVVKPDEAHPGTDDGMPPLCLANMDIEVQVGCIPDEPGFQAGPSGDETEGQWCPCGVTWSPSHTDQPLELDQGTAYSVVAAVLIFLIKADNNFLTILFTRADLYGPLVSIQLKTPAGSDPEGPSPLCAPLTPSSNSPEALFRHNGAHLSIALDLQHWFLNGLERVRVIRMLAEDLFFAMDGAIKEQWRLAIDNFAEGYIGALKSRIQALFWLEATTGPGATSTSASPLL
eukprot:1155671-Pelagomonas_calceolata.AAC.2